MSVQSYCPNSVHFLYSLFFSILLCFFSCLSFFLSLFLFRFLSIMIQGLDVSSIIFFAREMGFLVCFRAKALPIAPFPCIFLYSLFVLSSSLSFFLFLFLFFSSIMIQGLDVSSIIFFAREMGFLMCFRANALPIAPFPCMIEASSSCSPTSLKTDPFLK